MATTQEPISVDAGRMESKIVAPSEEIQHEFSEASHLGSAGQQHLIDKLRDHHLPSPDQSGGYMAPPWEDVDLGEERVGAGNPVPDQNNVEEFGKAVGLSFEDNEPLNADAKMKARDQSRWELNAASSEGYEGRMKNEGEYEEK
jgi:hypothetical protein